MLVYFDIIVDVFVMSPNQGLIVSSTQLNPSAHAYHVSIFERKNDSRSLFCSHVGFFSMWRRRFVVLCCFLLLQQLFTMMYVFHFILFAIIFIVNVGVDVIIDVVVVVRRVRSI